MARYASMIHGNVKRGDSHPAVSLTTDDATVLGLNVSTQTFTFNSSNLDFMAADPAVNSTADLSDYVVWHSGVVAKRMPFSDLQTLLGVVDYSEGNGIDITGGVISLDIAGLGTLATPASADYIPLLDDTDSGNKRALLSDIADLALYNAVKLQGRGVLSTSPSTGQALVWNSANWAPATLNYMPADPAVNSGATLTDYGVWHNGSVAKRILLSDLQTLINTDTTYTEGTAIDITSEVVSVDISGLIYDSTPETGDLLLIYNGVNGHLITSIGSLPFMDEDPAVNSSATLSDYTVWHNGTVGKRMLFSDLKTLLGVTTYTEGNGIDITGGVISADLTYLNNNLNFLTTPIWAEDNPGIHYSGDVGIGVSSNSLYKLLVETSSVTAGAGALRAVHSGAISNAFAVVGRVVSGTSGSAGVYGYNLSTTTSLHYGGIFNAQYGSNGIGISALGGLASARFGSSIQLAELSSSPATPDSGYGALYVKTDGKLYFKNDAGNETALT